MFHELDLLVLRPFVKKKKLFAYAPPSARARRFQNEHLHEGPKNTRKDENSKFEIYFLTYKPRKKGIFKGASADGKNTFLKVFDFY